MKPEGLYFTCPVCGEDVPRKAKSCPECGACEKSGWSDEARYDGLHLPSDDFSYERFTAEEFGGGVKKVGKEWLWWFVAVLLLVALVWSTVGSRW
jgi:hypothetical protein